MHLGPLAQTTLALRPRLPIAQSPLPPRSPCFAVSPPDFPLPTCSTATSVCATLFRRKGASGAAGLLQSRCTHVSSAARIWGRGERGEGHTGGDWGEGAAFVYQKASHAVGSHQYGCTSGCSPRRGPAPTTAEVHGQDTWEQQAWGHSIGARVDRCTGGADSVPTDGHARRRNAPNGMLGTASGAFSEPLPHVPNIVRRRTGHGTPVPLVVRQLGLRKASWATGGAGGGQRRGWRPRCPGWRLVLLPPNAPAPASRPACLPGPQPGVSLRSCLALCPPPCATALTGSRLPILHEHPDHLARH